MTPAGAVSGVGPGPPWDPPQTGRRLRRTSVLLQAKPWSGAIHLPRTGCDGVPAKGSAFCGAGQNARLAAKLTGWKIDIKPASAPEEEEPEVEEETETEREE